MKQYLLLIALLAGFLRPLRSQTQNEQILERLDRLEKQNAELLTEIKALRQMVAAPPGKAAAPGPPGEASQPDLSEQQAEKQEVQDRRIEELQQTKVESSQRFPIQLTGTALFNAYLNGVNSGGNQDPVVASSNAGARSSGASFRQTVLGLKFTGPQTLWGGSVSGSVYLDFFGGSSDSLNHLVRLRVATVQLDWPNTTFAVGQDKPLVSRREPNSFAQVGVSPLTGAGNPWRWQPQARLEQRFHLGPETTVKAEAGIFQTYEDNSRAGLPAPSAVEAARPAFESRLSVRRDFGESRSVELAPVFHTSSSHSRGTDIQSRLYGVDWLVRPVSKVEVTGLLFKGQNFGNLGALGGLNLTPSGLVIPVHGAGGWMQVRYMLNQKLSVDLYGGQEDDRNRDLQSGQIGKNQYYAGNVMYLLAPNVMSAFEFGQNRTTYLGIGNRLNNHYDLALAYLF